ncbi:hypothetical protein [Occallatibacter savannae]|uniref:hypothetical protein n=1 Tax=Occallatibacter savannae TaxID=1002691 RepID=UPI000D693204|nr:hypothetical protein [Occallatibacter savannae]
MVSSHFVHFEFPHRMNKDGTIDSVCPRCFATVGCSTWEAELERLEAAHSCLPARLAAFNDHHRRMPVAPERVPAFDIPADRSSIPVRNTWPHRAAPSRRSA